MAGQTTSRSREIVKLMVNLLLSELSEDLAKSHVVKTTLRPTTWRDREGMLSVAEAYIQPEQRGQLPRSLRPETSNDECLGGARAPCRRGVTAEYRAREIH